MTTTSRLLLLIPLLVVTVILLPKACAQHRRCNHWYIQLPSCNSIPLDSATEYIPQVHPKRHLLWNIVSICSSTSWELLLPRSNNISFDTTEYIRKLDSKHRLLWHVYRTSSTSERLAIVKEFNEELTRWEYINSRINMIGLFLFGPEKYQSTLSTVRGKKPIVDDWKCFKSTLELFEKHCCLLPELGSRHIRAFTNICNYVAEKAAIKEAIIVSCAMTKTEIYGIDVRNPSVQATPAPVSGSPDNYCARIFVNGTTSRWNLGSYARPYRVLLAVSRAVRHRDASLGLCECGNDEWRSLQNGTWSAVMSPYMTYYIDVKYTSRIYDSVNVTLDQDYSMPHNDPQNANFKQQFPSLRYNTVVYVKQHNRKVNGWDEDDKQSTSCEDGNRQNEVLVVFLGLNFLVELMDYPSRRVEMLVMFDTAKSKIQDMEGIPASKEWLKGSYYISRAIVPLLNVRLVTEVTLYLHTTPMRIYIKFYPTDESNCLKVEETETIDIGKAKINLKIRVPSDKLLSERLELRTVKNLGSSQWDPWGVNDDYVSEEMQNGIEIPKPAPVHSGPLPEDFFATLKAAVNVKPTEDEDFFANGWQIPEDEDKDKDTNEKESTIPARS
ncbi:hypothetical protein Tco_0473089 [Tanacetum coccineum]